jgi:hypothetical protein
MSKEYIEEQFRHLQLLGSRITPMRPGVGFYTTVDGLEISEDVFPEEYETIQKAWDSVVTKIEELRNQNKNQNKDE